MAELRRFVRAVGEWIEVEPRGLLERITGKRRAEERERGVNQVLNDIEVLKREAEFDRRFGMRGDAQ
jgi:hypothetical protein